VILTSTSVDIYLRLYKY